MDNKEYINQMYDSQKESTLSGLESSYQQNKAAAEQQVTQTAQNYSDQQNALAASFERNRRNNNIYMANNGLNNGTGAQARLATQNTYTANANSLAQQAAAANTAAQQNVTNIENNYRAQVQQAIADNDYNRAQALYKENQNAQDEALQKAKTLAGYGDFSGYAEVYGQDAANNMANMWAAQYPDAAYYMGKITADQYKAVTGKYPTGYSTKSTASGGAGGGGNKDTNFYALQMALEKLGYADKYGLDKDSYGYWGEKSEAAANAANADGITDEALKAAAVEFGYVYPNK